MPGKFFQRQEKTKQIHIPRKLYNEARIYYDSAMVNWQRENERFIYFRDYDKVVMFAELSAKKATRQPKVHSSSASNLKVKA